MLHSQDLTRQEISTAIYSTCCHDDHTFDLTQLELADSKPVISVGGSWIILWGVRLFFWVRCKRGAGLGGYALCGTGANAENE